jgi:hypothetical protein
MKSTIRVLGCAAALVFSAATAHAAALVATYDFNDTLAATGGGAPSLVSVDPLGTNSFETALVNGVSQRVFHWRGDGSDPARHAGLRLDTTGLLSYDNYSIEMTFEFLTGPAFGGGWRRIVDTQNRQSDNGFYVSPSNVLQVYPVVDGTTVFTDNVFHTVVLTNFVFGGVRDVRAYLDGNLELMSDTDQLNLDNANNPGHLLHFFLDNLVSFAPQEYADGRIARLRLFDGIVVPGDVPEPGSMVLVLVALFAMHKVGRRWGV